jgi:hypothetical protein
MPDFRMGVPFRSTLGRRPGKPSDYLHLDPEITVAPENVLWIAGWWEYRTGEPYQPLRTRFEGAFGVLGLNLCGVCPKNY